MLTWLWQRTTGTVKVIKPFALGSTISEVIHNKSLMCLLCPIRSHSQLLIAHSTCILDARHGLRVTACVALLALGFGFKQTC